MKKKAIEVLKSLITINDNRIEGYEKASKETEDFGLKTLFEQFISNSEKCKQELVMEVTSLGGETAEGKKVIGNFFDGLKDVKTALFGKDLKAILNSCWYEENKVMDTYNIVLNNDSEHLSPEQIKLIYSHILLLKDDLDHVKAMRNMEAPIATPTKIF